MNVCIMRYVALMEATFARQGLNADHVPMAERMDFVRYTRHLLGVLSDVPDQREWSDFVFNSDHDGLHAP